MKFFTVIIPLYNPNLSRLEKGLESIASQPNVDEIEVIFVDDCSPDKSYARILKQFDFDMELYTMGTNVGQGIARQVGIDNAHGTWVTFLDQDDTFSENAFVAVHNFITLNNVDYLLTTQELISNGYDDLLNNQFDVIDQNATLHGDFFNREFLIDNDIRFSELRHQEDTYFMTLVTNIIGMDDRYKRNDNAIGDMEFVTYFWYLWEDSTSHTKINGMEYLEATFDDYIKANYNATMEVIRRYPSVKNHSYMFSKHISLWYYCYWFYISYEYNYPENDHSDMVEYIKELTHKMLEDFDIDKDGMWKSLWGAYDIYHLVVQSIIHNVPKLPIPNITVKEFYDLVA